MTLGGGRPREDSLRQRTLKGFVVTLGGAGTQGLLQVLVVSILARLLSPEDFGVVGAALTVVGLSSILSQLGVGPALVQRRTLEEDHVRAGFTLSLTLGAFLMGVVWLTAPALERFLGLTDFVPVLRVLSLVFLIQSLSTTSQALLQRELRFGVLAVAHIASYLIGFGAVGVVLAAQGAGVWALVAANLVQATVRALVVLATRRHAWRPTLKRSATRDLLLFGVGMSLGKVLNYVATQADNLVVAKVLGAGPLGIYGRAYQLVVAPATLFGSVTNKVLFPALAQVQNDPRRLTLGYLSAVSIVATVTLPLSALMWLFAPEIVALWLGPQWVAVVAPLRILSVAILFRTSYKLSDSVVRAAGAVYRRAWRQGVYAGLVIGGSILGARSGVAGVAAAVLVAVVANFLMMAHLALHESGGRTRDFVASHVPGLLLAAVALSVAWASAYGLHALGAGAYLAAGLACLAATACCLFLVLALPRRFAGSGMIIMMSTARSFRNPGSSKASRG
jgi:PST family polysaccharide transporter